MRPGHHGLDLVFVYPGHGDHVYLDCNPRGLCRVNPAHHVFDPATGKTLLTKGPGGLFPGGRNLARPRYWRMLTEIPRFHRSARRLLAGPEDDRTLDQFLDNVEASWP